MDGGWLLENNSLQTLKIEKRDTQGQIVPILQTQFSSLNGFALYYFELLDAELFADWTVEATQPSLFKRWLKIRPDPALCQISGGSGTRYSFNSVSSLEVQTLYNVGNDFIAGVLTIVTGDQVVSHQAI